VTGRLLASLLVGALAVAGGAGLGWSEPRPADRILPVEAAPIAARTPMPLDSRSAAGALKPVEVERAASAPELAIAPVDAPAASVPSSAQAATIERAAGALVPVGGLSDLRSKP
jgi:hypothetical protein